MGVIDDFYDEREYGDVSKAVLREEEESTSILEGTGFIQRSEKLTCMLAFTVGTSMMELPMKSLAAISV